jgi:hypothetical protein
LPGPEGTWPLRYGHLVQQVLDSYCTSCHRQGSEYADAADFSNGQEAQLRQLRRQLAPLLWMQ